MQATTHAPILGMIVPPADGRVPAEAEVLCPQGVRFTARGLGLQALTLDGYGAVIDRVATLARELKEQDGAAAIALMGTSLSFFRGRAFNDELNRVMHAATGLPTVTMSDAIRDALMSVGARRIAIGTAYTDEVNAQLRAFLQECGFEVLAIRSLGLTDVPDIHAVSEDQVVELGRHAARDAGPRAEAVLISCGGLTAQTLAPQLEKLVGMPVVASATAGVWASLRLLGVQCRHPALGALARAPAEAEDGARRQQIRGSGAKAVSGP